MRFALLAETLRNRTHGERHSKEGNDLPSLRLETVYVAGNSSSSILGSTKVSVGPTRKVEHKWVRADGAWLRKILADIFTSRRQANGRPCV